MAEHSGFRVFLVVAIIQAGYASLQPVRNLVSSNTHRHIWSRCDRLDRDFTGCTQNKPLTCADRASPGPADADVEIHLAGLPASSQTLPVYLHFWAPRKHAPYKPLVSPVGCMVYRNILDAHPKYYDSDFNGGNVRVSGSGEAVIRVRAPSTYFVWRYIAIPHIRLRLCETNVSIQHKPPDATLYFGLNEMWVKSDPGARNIQVSTAAPYADRVAQRDEMTRGPKPVARIVAVRPCRPRSSPFTTTTPITTTTVTTLPLSDSEVMIDAARDALSLAALEYSPVYACFLLGQFFDHFSEDCVEECPEGSEPVHGQCSRTSSEVAVEEITAAWKLEVTCDYRDACLPDSNRTLHMARLAVASHLDIPFQEVRVGVSFTEQSSRRLLDVLNVYFRATVNTRRMNQAYGERLLDMLIADVEFARELLGVDIRRIEILGNMVSGQQRVMEMGEFNDPYSPAYQEFQPVQKSDPKSVFGSLREEVVFGIAAGIIFLGTSLVTMVCIWRRKKAREALVQERAQQKVSMDSVEENAYKENAVATNDLEKPSNKAKGATRDLEGPKFATQVL